MYTGQLCRETPQLLPRINMRYNRGPFFNRAGFIHFVHLLFLNWGLEKRYKGYIDHSEETLICKFRSQMPKLLSRINMQYIVRIPSFKKGEYIQFVNQYTTPPKAYILAYPRKIQPLIWVITPAISETCESIGRPQRVKANVNLVVF
jgi:hypothetical protein